MGLHVFRPPFPAALAAGLTARGPLSESHHTADRPVFPTGIASLQDDEDTLQAYRVQQFLQGDHLCDKLCGLLLRFLPLESRVRSRIKIRECDPALTLYTMCIAHKALFKAWQEEREQTCHEM